MSSNFLLQLNEIRNILYNKYCALLTRHNTAGRQSWLNLPLFRTCILQTLHLSRFVGILSLLQHHLFWECLTKKYGMIVKGLE